MLPNIIHATMLLKFQQFMADLNGVSLTATGLEDRLASISHLTGDSYKLVYVRNHCVIYDQDWLRVCVVRTV